MKPTPTKFKGRIYRSFLEAKWAAFFTDLGWRFEYEPYELPGWLPDFELVGEHGVILVEVKPFSTSQEFGQAISKSRIALDTKNLDREVLFLGTSPFMSASGQYANLGWIDHNKHNTTCGAAVTKEGDRWGFTPTDDPIEDRIHGTPDATFAPYDTVEFIWNDAANKVMWKRPAMPAKNKHKTAKKPYRKSPRGRRR